MSKNDMNVNVQLNQGINGFTQYIPFDSPEYEADWDSAYEAIRSTSPAPRSVGRTRRSLLRNTGDTAAPATEQVIPGFRSEAAETADPVPMAEEQPQLRARLRQRGNNLRTAATEPLFGNGLQNRRGSDIRTRRTNLTSAEPAAPAIGPGPGIAPPGLLRSAARTLLVVASLGLAVVGIVSNWEMISRIGMQFVVAWILLFITLTFFARRYLQVNQIAVGATVLSVIAVVLVNNVFGIGTAVSYTVSSILSALIPLAILAIGLVMILRSLFRSS